jgi:3D (Asp-Asp-Asp) domain-containing protein
LLAILALTVHATARITGTPVTAQLRAVLTTSDIATAEDIAAAYETAEDQGHLPGDDIPALERCYLTDEEIEAAENQLIESALLARANIIENCVVTAYCAEQYPHICGTGDGIAYDGTPAIPYATCAVDPDVIPLGSTILVDLGDGEGLRYFVANDTGKGVDGDHIDLCVGSHDEAVGLGVRTATVYWCEEG